MGLLFLGLSVHSRSAGGAGTSVVALGGRHRPRGDFVTCLAFADLDVVVFGIRSFLGRPRGLGEVAVSLPVAGVAHLVRGVLVAALFATAASAFFAGVAFAAFEGFVGVALFSGAPFSAEAGVFIRDFSVATDVFLVGAAFLFGDDFFTTFIILAGKEMCSASVFLADCVTFLGDLRSGSAGFGGAFAFLTFVGVLAFVFAMVESSDVRISRYCSTSWKRRVSFCADVNKRDAQCNLSSGIQHAGWRQVCKCSRQRHHK